MSFLKAEWRKLAIANYAIDKDLLHEYVPAGTELDLWNGKCFVSLVGFLFKNTRLLGFKIPYHVNFEEVNLRFYVKRLEQGEWKRGVVYGKAFDFLNAVKPSSVMLAEGSEITVENKRTISISQKVNNDKRLPEQREKTAGLRSPFQKEIRKRLTMPSFQNQNKENTIPKEFIHDKKE